MPGRSKEGFVEILKWKIRGCLNGGWMSNEQVVERIKRVSRSGGGWPVMEHLYLNEEASIESEMRLLPLICERRASHTTCYFICVKHVKRTGWLYINLGQTQT